MTAMVETARERTDHPELPSLRVVLCAPRGFCAGVVRAIDAVERAIERFGAPVYVRHEIVHNRYVVDMLKKKGSNFSSRSSKRFRMRVHLSCFRPMAYQSRCPLPLKNAACWRSMRHAHWSRRCIAKRRFIIAAIGWCCSSAMITIPRSSARWASCRRAAVMLVQSVDDVGTIVVPDEANLAFVTQTTLSIDDTAEIVAALKARFSRHRWPASAGHLLRHHQPSGSCEARGPDGRCE